MSAALSPEDRPDFFAFGQFALDTRRRNLSRGGHSIPLRPKSFDVLCCLLGRAGRVVSREEILNEVWPNVCVTDESLSRCISDIRQALADDKQEIIKTLPRHGYLVAVPVRLENKSQAAGTTWARPRSLGDISRRSAVALAVISCLLLCIVVLGTATWLHGAEPVSQAPPSVAVLPFANHGADREGDYFSEGLSEDIAIRLAKLPEIVVIANESAAKFKGSTTDLTEIAQKLGCRYLVLGSVRDRGHQLQISARLVEAANGKQDWAEIYQVNATDLPLFQDELAGRIAGILSSKITQAELERVRQKPPANLSAYHLFLRGRAALARADTSKPEAYAGEVVAARNWLEKAIALDPDYAPALTALSDAYHRGWLVGADDPVLRADFQNPQVSEHALNLAKRAVADPTFADAHAQLAWILHWRYRRSDALTEFRRALELNPNLTDGRFALALAHSGKPQEAIRVLDRIFERDPLHRPLYLSFLANAYYLAQRYTDALETSRTTVDRLPAIYQAHAWHAASAAQVGLYTEAHAAATAVLRFRPTFTASAFLNTIRLDDQQQSLRLREGLLKAGLPP